MYLSLVAFGYSDTLPHLLVVDGRIIRGHVAARPWKLLHTRAAVELLCVHGRRRPSLNMALGCMYALLLAGATSQLLDGRGHTASQWTEEKGQPTTAELIGQQVAPTLATASLVALADAGEPAVSSPASLPASIYESAERGELQKVVKWLRKGGAVDAFGSALTADGRISAVALLLSLIHI